MQRSPQRRQIIKTRDQRPYIVARVLIVLLVLALLAWLGWHFAHPRVHPAFEVPHIVLTASGGQLFG